MADTRFQSGENNPSWKGDGAGYDAFHKRVVKARGKPRVCAACDTKTAKRYEWANLTGNYADVHDYVRLCKSCHNRIDGVIDNLGDSRCKFSPETRREAYEACQEDGISQKEVAERFGMSPATVSRIANCEMLKGVAP